MKLCLVSREYPPDTASGGIGTQTYAKAHGLADRGHDVHVLSASTRNHVEELMDGAVRVTRIPGVYPKLPVYTEAADWIAYSSEVAVELTRLDSAYDFDLVDFPEWSGEGFVFLLNRTESNWTPAVVQLHGPIVMFANTVGWPTLDSDLYRVGTVVESTSLRLADAVYSSSACSARWAAESYGLDASLIPTIHTGVDTSRFVNRRRENGGRPTILFVGRITGDKGAYALLKAAEQLVHVVPDLRLRLVGHIDDEAELQRHAAALPEGVLELGGFVGRDDLPGELARADVFAAPSIYEPGPGLVNLEAMACGLPVVACAGAGAAEVVSDGENGRLVRPGDADELAEVLGALLRDPAERLRLGGRAREDAVDRFDTHVCLDRLEVFYEAVLTRQAVVSR